MANLDCSGMPEVEDCGIFAGGTGIYELMRLNRDCFWVECSGSGSPSAWMLTARPLKQGMVLQHFHSNPVLPSLCYHCCSVPIWATVKTPTPVDQCR